MQELNVRFRMDAKDGFYGDRTNAVKPHYTGKEGEQITYYDVTSLYPNVNK